MITSAISASAAVWADYLELAKPRIVALITFTALVGMLLARLFQTPRHWRILNLAMAALLAASLIPTWR